MTASRVGRLIPAVRVCGGPPRLVNAMQAQRARRCDPSHYDASLGAPLGSDGRVVAPTFPRLSGVNELIRYHSGAACGATVGSWQKCQPIAKTAKKEAAARSRCFVLRVDDRIVATRCRDNL